MVERDGNGAGSCEEGCKHLEVYVIMASERINEIIHKTLKDLFILQHLWRAVDF